MKKFKLNHQIVLLSLISILALVLRLYKIDAPLADHHSWRQVDSAAVIRNLATEKFDLLRPRWDNLLPTNAQGLVNPELYFFEDFPLGFDVYPALLYQVFGVQEKLARLTAIIFSLGTMISLYFLTRLLIGPIEAILAAFYWAILPYSVFYSRSILQEPAAMFYLVGSLFLVASWAKDKNKTGFTPRILIAALLYALALLTKSYNLFFAPLFAYLFWWKDGFQVLKKKSPYLFFLVAFSFFGGWWWWIGKHPEGLPYSSWLLNEGNIRFKGAWFYWLFAERMGKLILGYWGLVLLGIGLVLQAKKEKYFFHLWFLGQIAFMAVFAKGNVTHDYYQYLFLPFGVVFLAKGSRWLLTVPGKHFSRILSAGLFFLCLLFGVAFSWYFVRDFYNLQGGVDLAGKAVDQLVPSGALVVAGDGADPTLLYNTNRTGWTIGFGSTLENTPAVLQKLIDEEADYYVTTKIDALQGSGFGDYLKHNFNVIKETDQFIIYSLQPK